MVREKKAQWKKNLTTKNLDHPWQCSDAAEVFIFQ